MPKQVTVTISKEQAEYWLEQAGEEIEFWESVKENPRRTDEHKTADEMLASWENTRSALKEATK